MRREAGPTSSALRPPAPARQTASAGSVNPSSELREAMKQTVPPPRRQKSREPRGKAVRQDTVAGLVNAVVSVPDGLASATLAGVNPVYGLYASIAAPIAGSALV